MDYRKIQKCVYSLGKDGIPFSYEEYIYQIFKAFSKGTIDIKPRPSWLFKYDRSLSDKIPYGHIYISVSGVDVNSDKLIAIYVKNTINGIYMESIWLDLEECDELVKYLKENTEKLNSWYKSELNCRLMNRIRELYPDGDRFENTMIEYNKVRMTGIQINATDLTHLIDHINSMSEPIDCTDITVKNWYKGGIQLILTIEVLK